MSRLYDTVEPSVIDEDMLQKAVEEQGPKDEAGKIAKAEGIDFGDVESLRLEFKSMIFDFFNTFYYWFLLSILELYIQKLKEIGNYRSGKHFRQQTISSFILIYMYIESWWHGLMNLDSLTHFTDCYVFTVTFWKNDIAQSKNILMSLWTIDV